MALSQQLSTWLSCKWADCFDRPRSPLLAPRRHQQELSAARVDVSQLHQSHAAQLVRAAESAAEAVAAAEARARREALTERDVAKAALDAQVGGGGGACMRAGGRGHGGHA